MGSSFDTTLPSESILVLVVEFSLLLTTRVLVLGLQEKEGKERRAKGIKMRSKVNFDCDKKILKGAKKKIRHATQNVEQTCWYCCCKRRREGVEGKREKDM